VLDFDGTLVDTEWPEYAAWAEVYRTYGQRLSLAAWRRGVGTARTAFDPVRHLQGLMPHPPDGAQIRTRFQAYYRPALASLRARPFALRLIRLARREGWRTALCSNSSREWVLERLHQVGIVHAWDAMATGDEVAALKPDPALYRLALARLGLDSAACLAVEDSPHGAAAALAAGMPCLAVPNRITRGMLFPAQARVVAARSRWDRAHVKRRHLEAMARLALDPGRTAGA
jgi:putative hydrolase of the HAD superfamily